MQIKVNGIELSMFTMIERFTMRTELKPHERASSIDKGFNVTKIMFAIV